MLVETRVLQIVTFQLFLVKICKISEYAFILCQRDSEHIFFVFEVLTMYLFFQAVNGECIPCDGPCPKTCKGVKVLTAGNIGTFEDCTVIEGSLTIVDTTFAGFQEIYDNYTFGPRHPALHPDALEVFNTLREVTGYVSIQATHQQFKNLSYFR